MSGSGLRGRLRRPDLGLAPTVKGYITRPIIYVLGDEPVEAIRISKAFFDRPFAKEAEMLRMGLTISAALLGFTAFDAPALAASFDCARARQADEVTVCRNPRLSEMDTEMGALWFAYSRVPMGMSGNGDRRAEAEAFLDRRRACGRRVTCLTAAYRARNAALRSGIAIMMEHLGE